MTPLHIELVSLAKNHENHQRNLLVASLDRPTIELILKLRDVCIHQGYLSVCVMHQVQLVDMLLPVPPGAQRVNMDVPPVLYERSLTDDASRVTHEVTHMTGLVVSPSMFWFCVEISIVSDPIPITHEYFSPAVGKEEISVEKLVQFLVSLHHSA